MGYTHYWKLKSDNADLFSDAVSLFKECLFWMPKTTSVKKWSEEKGAWIKARVSTALHGWDGEGEPVITDSEICFNGDWDKIPVMKHSESDSEIRGIISARRQENPMTLPSALPCSPSRKYSVMIFPMILTEIEGKMLRMRNLWKRNGNAHIKSLMSLSLYGDTRILWHSV